MLLRRKIDRYVYEQKRHKEHDGKQTNGASSGEKTGKDQTATTTTVSKNQGGRLSDRPEADQNMKGKLSLFGARVFNLPLWKQEL